MSSFHFTRLCGVEKQRTTDLRHWLSADGVAQQSVAQDKWLLVSPHDDDLCLGSGMLMQAAVAAGVDLQVLVVTDGCLGYCSAEQQDSIVDIRRQETFESFAILGIAEQQVAYIDYPDGGLTQYVGRRRAQANEAELAEYVGLQNAFTYHLRRTRPARVFVPTHTDLHPDHRITHSELMISLFHAAGDIWPELGAPLSQVPTVYELAVYCDFAEPPNLELTGDDEAFAKKLASVRAFRSQKQIDKLVASVVEAGPYEYFREVEFRLYSAASYRALFQ